MADSLRDQLLKAGFASKPVQKDRHGARKKKRGHASREERGGSASGSAGPESDLARAYALRAKAEAAERRKQKAEAERQARERRERKRKIHSLLDGAVLNKPDAPLARHFEYGGKIRRVYVDAEQLAQINAGTLAIVQWAGRYLIVSEAVAGQVQAIAPEALALRHDPSAVDDASVADDGVPDDLIW